MYKVVRKSEGVIRQIASNKTANNLISKDISPNISFATTEAVEYYEKETTLYDRIYYVLEGALEIVVDKEINVLQVGDVCFLGRGTTYEMRGTFKVVTVNQPAFGS